MNLSKELENINKLFGDRLEYFQVPYKSKLRFLFVYEVALSPDKRKLTIVPLIYIKKRDLRKYKDLILKNLGITISDYTKTYCKNYNWGKITWVQQWTDNIEIKPPHIVKHNFMFPTQCVKCNLYKPEGTNIDLLCKRCYYDNIISRE